jgi:hypothetical protein
MGGDEPDFNSDPARVVKVIRQALAAGKRVHIDNLGSFRKNASGQYEFIADGRPLVFLAYVEEDRERVHRLYEIFAKYGLNPWMDVHKLLPGQNWPRAIERAINRADFFVACMSSSAVGKRGVFQSELRYALDCERQTPFDDVYFIPVRLDDCQVPARIRSQHQHVDLFPHFENAARRLADFIRREAARRKSAA